MKIDSAEVAMGSARVFAEVDSTAEKLNAWVGRRPPDARYWIFRSGESP